MRVSKLLNFLYKKKKEKTLQGAKMYRQFCYFFFFPKKSVPLGRTAPRIRQMRRQEWGSTPLSLVCPCETLALPAVYQQWKEIPRLMNGKSDRQPRHLWTAATCSQRSVRRGKDTLDSSPKMRCPSLAILSWGKKKLKISSPFHIPAWSPFPRVQRRTCLSGFWIFGGPFA